MKHWVVDSEVSQWVGNVKPSTNAIGRCGMFNNSLYHESAASSHLQTNHDETIATGRRDARREPTTMNPKA